MLKKLLIAFFITSTTIFMSNAFAGVEDWHGEFVIANAAGTTTTATHQPTYLQFMFMTAKNTFSFSKNAKINNFVASEDGTLAVYSSVEDFTKELSKWGSITEQHVTLGNTYPA